MRHVCGKCAHWQTLSLILAIPATTVTRGAFRRQRGFEIIRIVFSKGLSWRSPKPTNDDAEREVEEVQRWEGVRLAFEVLAWALTEREGLKEFAVSHLNSYQRTSLTSSAKTAI